MGLTGAAVIVFSCLWMAHVAVKDRKRRVAAVEELCCALEQLRAELDVRLSPLPMLMEELAMRTSGCAAIFFAALRDSLAELGDKSFAALWKDAVEENLGSLSHEDAQAILALGSVLGRYELADQLAALDRCSLELRASAVRRRSQMPQDRRLCYALLTAGGCFLAIILY